MSDAKSFNVLSSKVIKTENVNWNDLKFLQNDDFKSLSIADKQKLKSSLVANQFIQPFYVWQDKDDTLYCLDGKHRTILLQELVTDGIAVPVLLPAVFIDCADKKEAAKMVLVFSSAYAKITQEGFHDFISINQLDLPDVLEQISIPDLKIDEIMPLPSELEGDPKLKPATMKITFVSHTQLEAAIPAIEELLKTKCPGAFFSVSFGEI